jgi:predicted nucleic acid-binding protein
MKYLLDTDHWSYLQRRLPPVMQQVNQLGTEIVSLYVRDYTG